MARWVLPLVLVVAMSATATDARAQTPPQAEVLFAEGRELLERSKYVEACSKLAKSQELSPAVGTLLNLAYCYEQLNRFRSAMDAYLEAEALAAGAADAKRAAFAKEHYALIEPRAPKLVVRVTPPEIAGLEVKRNGVAIPKAEFDRPIAVDPQDYVITASAPHHVAWRSAIFVKGDGAIVTVVVPPLESNAAPADVAEPSVLTTLGTRRIIALGLGGLSALAIGAGIATGLSAKSRYDDAGSHCDDTSCDETGTAIQRGAVAQGNVATVLVGLGLLAAGGGIYLWIVGAPEAKPRARAVRLEVRPLGAALGGQF